MEEETSEEWWLRESDLATRPKRCADILLHRLAGVGTVGAMEGKIGSYTRAQTLLGKLDYQELSTSYQHHDEALRLITEDEFEALMDDCSTACFFRGLPLVLTRCRVRSVAQTA